MELMNTDGTPCLQDLNEDCLLEIFSLKSLDLIDLCSIAETCKRFQQITQRVLPKDLHIDVSNNGDYDVSSRKYLRKQLVLGLHDLERIFNIFKSCLSEVSISSECQRTEEPYFGLHLVATHCVDKLEILKMVGLKIPEVLAVKLKPIFKQLQRLDMRDTSIYGHTALYSDFDSLVELSLSNVKNASAILDAILPKLERFTYKADRSKINQTLSSFISRHSNLKTLDLINGIDDEIIRAIGNSCRQLEELRLKKRLRSRRMWYERTMAPDLFPLKAVKSLKILKLSNVSCATLFISAPKNLRELHLSYCDLPKENYGSAFFAQLTKISIYEGFHDLDVVDLIRRLVNLEELTVCQIGFALDQKTFYEIVTEVNGRPHVLTLKCKEDGLCLTRCDNQNLKFIHLDDQYLFNGQRKINRTF